ncbi:MAG: hypothetical protein ACE1ZA_07750, partial [Pseudomonadales bacterium]
LPSHPKHDPSLRLGKWPVVNRPEMNSVRRHGKSRQAGSGCVNLYRSCGLGGSSGGRQRVMAADENPRVCWSADTIAGYG